MSDYIGERAPMPTFANVQEILDYARKSDQETFDHIQRVFTDDKLLGYAVEAACTRRRTDSGRWEYYPFQDAAEVFDHVLAVARVAKAEHPDLTLQTAQFEYWSSPWGFETKDAVIYAMFCAASYLESDEFTISDDDETVAAYAELIRWGREAGVTAEQIGKHADALFRGNHAVAEKLGFGAYVTAEEVEG